MNSIKIIFIESSEIQNSKHFYQMQSCNTRCCTHTHCFETLIGPCHCDGFDNLLYISCTFKLYFMVLKTVLLFTCKSSTFIHKSIAVLYYKYKYSSSIVSSNSIFCMLFFCSYCYFFIFHHFIYNFFGFIILSAMYMHVAATLLLDV